MPFSKLIRKEPLFTQPLGTVRPLYIGQAFRYSPEKDFYIFNQQIYFIT